MRVYSGGLIESKKLVAKFLISSHRRGGSKLFYKSWGWKLKTDE